MPDAGSAQAVSDAIRATRGDRTQEWLGAAVAGQEGRDEAYNQNTVAGWESGRYALKPAKLFAIEAALGVPPGSLSQLAGYVPVGTVAARSVADAVEADPGLSVEQKEDLVAQYEGMLARTRARQKKRRSRSAP
jgi:hypothetical protein